MSNVEPVSAAITQFLAQLFSQHSSQDSSQEKTQFIVALSGGADSLALLHGLSQQFCTNKIQAVYIDHQLQEDSSRWAEQNREFCQNLGVDYQVVSVAIDSSISSLENSARIARYEALVSIVKHEGCYLLTGHHQDDQAETLLLQLFRGAGPKGLSAMPELTDFALGFHARPLLSVTKQDIVKYCQQYGLAYIEDPSNQSSEHRRNFLRNDVLPLVKTVWPNLSSTLSRAGKLQASTQQIITERAEEDFLNCWSPDKRSLDISAVTALSKPRRDNTLRYWFERLGFEMPSYKVLNQLTKQMLESNDDAQPSVELEQGAFKRFDGDLYWVPYQALNLKLGTPVEWAGESDLLLSSGVKLSAQWLQQGYPELVGCDLTVTTRQGGERLRKRNSDSTTSLKNYLQDTKVPSWLRDKVLLVMFEGEVRAVYTQHLKDLI